LPLAATGNVEPLGVENMASLSGYFLDYKDQFGVRSNLWTKTDIFPFIKLCGLIPHKAFSDDALLNSLMTLVKTLGIHKEKNK
jgi:hypothetical protein